MKYQTLAAVAILATAACAQQHAPARDPVVTNVVSAHHGECPPAARRIFAHRAAQLFAHPVPYVPYHCMSWTQAHLLHGDCGPDHVERNTVFITFKEPQAVTFVQGESTAVAHVRTFGSTWDGKRAILYFTNLFTIPLPPGVKRVKRYTGPPYFGLFGADGDPLGLKDGECPTADSTRT